MTGAVIALSLALAAAVGGLITLAVMGIAATKRAGSNEARATELAVRMEVAIANQKNEASRADAEKRRADALDQAIARMARRLPIDGSYAELLEEAERARAGAPGADDSPVVRDAGAAGGSSGDLGPDDLLPPGA